MSPHLHEGPAPVGRGPRRGLRPEGMMINYTCFDSSLSPTKERCQVSVADASGLAEAAAEHRVISSRLKKIVLDPEGSR